MDAVPTPKQLKLLRELVAELRSYQTLHADRVERRIARLSTLQQASELIDSTIKILREYQLD